MVYFLLACEYSIALAIALLLVSLTVKVVSLALEAPIRLPIAYWFVFAPTPVVIFWLIEGWHQARYVQLVPPHSYTWVEPAFLFLVAPTLLTVTSAIVWHSAQATPNGVIRLAARATTAVATAASVIYPVLILGLYLSGVSLGS